MSKELTTVPAQAVEATPDTLWMQAAADKSLPAENLRIIAEVKWRHEDREAQRAFTRDMIACQQEIPHITKRGEIHNREGKVQSRYAKFEDIDKVVKPIAGKYGFAYRFLSAPSPVKDEILARIVVSHASGHSETSEISVPRDTSGAKNAAQGSGSSFSYAKRHLLKGAFNIVEEGEDTDGHDLTPISEDQVLTLTDMLNELENRKPGARGKFMKWIGVEKLSDIRAKDYAKAHGALKGSVK